MNESKSKPEALVRAEKFERMLHEAIIYGYDVLLGTTFDFSPISTLLDCAVDIILILRRMFEEGAQAAQNNAGLGFSEIYSDSLGNPKQFKITTPSKYYWDPNAREIFWSLAQTFIRIKNQKSIKESFHDFFDEIGLKSTPTKGSNRKKKTAQYFWWRRQNAKRRSMRKSYP